MTDVVTGEAVVLDVRAARLPSRMLAFGIDLVVQLLLLFGLGMLILPAGLVVNAALLTGTLLVVEVGVIVGYPVVCESLWRGRSLGKLALGLRVVSQDGGPERFRQALVRGLAASVEIWLLFGSIAIFASLLSHQGKRLGDHFAGTLVIRERIPARGGRLPWMPPALVTWAQGLELTRLPNDVAAMARQYIARYPELAPEVRDEMGHRIATTVSVYVSPAPPTGTHPVAYLSAVLAERRRREEWRLHAQRPHDGPPRPLGQSPGPYDLPPLESPEPAARPAAPPEPPSGFAPPS